MPMRLCEQFIPQFIKGVIPIRANNIQLIRPRVYISQIGTTYFTIHIHK